MNFETSVNVSHIVDMIFTKPPLPPCTFALALSDECIEHNVTMFQMLMNILISGARKLFGDDIQPQHITDTQFDKLKEYMISMSYEIKYNYTYADDGVTPVMINIWFEPYKNIPNCGSGKGLI